MARPPKPIEQHIADGTWRADRHALPVVVGGRDIPSAPAHFTDLAQLIWDEIVRMIEPILDRADMGVVEGAALMLARAHEATRLVNEEGMIVTQYNYDKDGNVTGEKRVENAALKIERQSMQAFVVFADRLGMSPVARARLGLQLVRGRSAQEQLEDTIGRSPLDEPPHEAEPLVEETADSD